MAEVTPFRGIRYAQSVDLDAVVAPPYDVIPAAHAAELRARNPHNAVHVDLPVAPGETPEEAAYADAADAFTRWRTDGVLRRDHTPSLYLVDQTYTGPDGIERTRRGFIARLRLADFSERVVLPHERTHAGPKVDRLRLYRAAHADLSQIFLLFADDDGSAGAALETAASEADPAAARDARDGDGNLHHVVPLAGAAADRAAAALAGRPLYIADGHHRYETALAYRDERRAAGDPSADTLMVYLCSIADPGLTVFPTHRLVRGVEVPELADLIERLRPLFDVVGEPISGIEASRAALERLGDEGDPRRVFGLYLAREDACLIVKTREPAATRELLAAGFSVATAELSVTILHELILGQVLGMDHDAAERHIDYVKNVPDAMTALKDGDHTFGAFLNATRIGQVRAVADAGEVMPQKSTYFYPKLLTGLVYDALGD